MSMSTRKYGKGTELTTMSPWGLFVRGRVLCSDGKVRALHRIAPCADTFFSVPASVKVKGKTVSGFVTFETLSGSSIETEEDPGIAKFVAVSNGKNAHLLPGLAFRGQ